MQVIHAKVILKVDFQKGNQSSLKKKKVNNSMLLYMNIHLWDVIPLKI